MEQRQPGGLPRQSWQCLLCFLAPDQSLSWKQRPAGDESYGWTSRASLRELGERPGIQEVTGTMGGEKGRTLLGTSERCSPELKFLPFMLWLKGGAS